MRDERAELIMKEHDIQPPAVGSVTLKSVHLDPHAATYQARSQSDRLNEEMLEVYTNSYRRPDADFPAIVVNRRPDGTWDILGGFHRANAAHNAGRKEHDAYKMELDPYKADILARTLNSTESVGGTSRNERLAQAMYLVREKHYTIEKAATIQGISANSLTSEIRAREVRMRVLGTNQTVDVSNVPTSSLAELQRIHSDVVLTTLVDLINKARLGNTQFRDVVAEIQRTRSEAGQLSVIESFKRTPLVQDRLEQYAKGRSHGPRVYRKVSLLARNILAATSILKANPTPASLGMTDDDWLVLMERKAELDRVFNDCLYMADDKVLRRA